MRPARVAVAQVADAVVIGSRLIQEMEATPRERAVAAVEALVREIRTALDAWRPGSGVTLTMQLVTKRAGRIRSDTMSWIDKILPPRIKREEGRPARSSPKACGPSARAAKRCCTAPSSRRRRWCARSARTTFASARAQRLDALMDAEGPLRDRRRKSLPVDALKFKDSRKYTERLQEAMEETGETDALVVMGGSITCGAGGGRPCFEFDFMGGSMGSVVGERFVRGVGTAIEQKVPFICITSTGGARMQEGLLSLLQMAKTTAMIAQLAEARLPFISVLADPTMGGVSASFAFMGDVVIAEPKALIGFAGPRVIEQTVREKLPEGFQRAEFLLTKGAIDMIVDRREMRDEIARAARAAAQTTGRRDLIAQGRRPLGTATEFLGNTFAGRLARAPRAPASQRHRSRARPRARRCRPARSRTVAPTIVVGGTNGKGSTCAMLESILRAAGYRTGLYTSPHLLEFNERARIDGVDAATSN